MWTLLNVLPSRIVCRPNETAQASDCCAVMPRAGARGDNEWEASLPCGRAANSRGGSSLSASRELNPRPLRACGSTWSGILTHVKGLHGVFITALFVVTGLEIN